MSQRIGPIAISSMEEETYLGRDLTKRKTHSEKTSQIIDEEIKLVIDNNTKIAEKILNDNIELLHRTAKILVERETLEADEFISLVEGNELPPISKNKLEAIKQLRIDHIVDDNDVDDDDDENNDSE